MSSTVSQSALEAAMKAAVACGMIPRHADEAMYLRNWDGMKAVLDAALAVQQAPDAARDAGAASEPRFKVVDGSQSAHCCFEATVVDTTNPVMIAGKHYENQYEALCETFDHADADLICAALNAHKPAEDGKGK